LVFLENVPGLLKFFGPIGEQLCGMGFEFEAGLFSAAEVGAPHKRERLFVLAYRKGGRLGMLRESSRGAGQLDGDSERMENAQSKGSSRRWSAPRCEAAASGISGSSSMANTRNGQLQEPRWRPEGRSGTGSTEQDVGNANKPGSQGWGESKREGGHQLPSWPPSPSDDAWARILKTRPDLAPAIECPVRGVFNELSYRVDRLRALGNAVVPATAELAFRTLWNRVK
jgi:DNA (cytosine-5)-methyltransferase 1